MKVKKFLIDALLVVFIIAIIAACIIIVKSQKVIEPYSINSLNSNTKVLIAAEKTDFKDSVMINVVEHFKGQDVYLSVIDVTQLNSVKAEEWDSIVIFSAVKVFKLEPVVDEFLQNQKDYGKIFMYVTSDTPKWKNNAVNVDTVTSASKKTNADKCTSDIINAIDKARK